MVEEGCERQPRPAEYLSTPMIKGELASLLRELVPDKRWPKSMKLKDLCDLAVTYLGSDTVDPRQRRALELAHVIRDHERR